MNRTIKATGGLMIATIIAKILGFSRELALASAYGTSSYSDAYLIALNIPTVIFAAIGQALTTTFIPLSYESRNDSDIKNSLNFTNNILNVVIIMSILFSVLGFIFTENIVRIFAAGFEGEVLKMAIDSTRILILGLVFNGLSCMMTAILQVENNFFIPGINTLPYNIFIIISIFLSIKYGYDILIWGTLFATSTTFLFQLPFAIKKGYKYNAYINIKDKYFIKMISLLGPVFIGVFVSQLNVLIDKSLASTTGQGSISALNYANKLNGFIVSMFIVSIVSVVYPKLSKLSSKENTELFKSTIAKVINIMILIIIPITVGVIVLAFPIVRILFERNAFDSNATMMTSISLICYSIGLIGVGLRDIISKVFYSIQDTKTPMLNGIVAVILNIVLNFILIRYMGYAGLALATSISSLVTVFLLFVNLGKKIGYFGQDKIIVTLIKSCISALVMGICTKTTYRLLTINLPSGFINEVITLSITIIVGIIVYGILIYILRINEIVLIVNNISQKIKLTKKSNKIN